MPSWRDKFRNKKGKLIKTPRQFFKDWFQGKKKLAQKKLERSAGGKSVAKSAKVAGAGRGKGKGKDAGKGAGRGAGRGAGKAGGSSVAEAELAGAFSGGVGRGVGRGAGRGRAAGRGSGVGRGVGRGRGAGRADADEGEGISLQEIGDDFGVGGSLIQKLLAVKQRLLAGTSEAAEQPVAEEEQLPKAADGKGKGRGRGRGGQEAPKQEKVPVVREELVALNRRFAELAQVRDLKGTREVLGTLEGKGWANPHSYAAAVHALCRCGDWREAEAALARAEAKRLFRLGSGIASGVIARTSMLRGYCECARDLSKARKLLARMERESTKAARPNTRTANTFLRGCLQLGAVAEAKALLRRMESQWGAAEEKAEGAEGQEEGGEEAKAKAEGEKEEKGGAVGEHVGAPDASSYEMVVSLLCQALCYDEAVVVAKRALKQLGSSPGSAAMFASIARAAALRGDLAAAKASLGRCNHLLQEEERAQGKKGSKSDAAGSGGKRGMAKYAEDGQDARIRSLEVFQTHRRAEVRAELKEVEAFMEAEGKKVDLSSLWRRTLAFEELGGDLSEAPVKGATRLARKRKRQALQAVAAQEGIAGALCRRLSQAFGLPPKGAVAEAVKTTFKSALSKGKSGGLKGQTWKQRKARAKAKAKAEAEGVEPTVQGKRLNLSLLFETPKKSDPRPVHLEICSGGGEWLCAQALRDSSACWVACEVRFDRAARCFQRLALRGLATAEGNAGLIVGDAHDALQQRLAPESCAQLFVNHPEPPHQTDLEATRAAAKEPGGSEQPATHLLTVSFLRDACGSVLRPGGTLTICTDSVEYGRFLLESVASKALAGVYEDALNGTPAAKVRRLAQEGDFGLRAEPPPVEVCGAEYKGEDGASYFQRLKLSERSSRGQTDEDRFFLCLRRRKT